MTARDTRVPIQRYSRSKELENPWGSLQGRLRVAEYAERLRTQGGLCVDRRSLPNGQRE